MLRPGHYRRFERSYCPRIPAQLDQGGSNKTCLYPNLLGLFDTTDANNTVHRDVINVQQSMQLNIRMNFCIKISTH